MPNDELNPKNDRWRWETCDEVDSTNRVAQERVLTHWGQGASADGVVIVSRRQTAGRGQHGRRWESPEGGLYMSVVIEDVPAELRARLALVVGMAVIEAVHETCPMEQEAGVLQIRWPNDVLLGGRKLAGVLCQALAQGERWATIIGIGINVNTSIHALPESVRDEAASIAGATGRAWEVEPLARRCASAVGHWMEMTGVFGIAGLVQCIARVDALKGNGVRMESDMRVVDGVGAGLRDDGALLLKKEDGSVEAFERGSILPPV